MIFSYHSSTIGFYGYTCAAALFYASAFGISHLFRTAGLSENSTVVRVKRKLAFLIVVSQGPSIPVHFIGLYGWWYPRAMPRLGPRRSEESHRVVPKMWGRMGAMLSILEGSVGPYGPLRKILEVPGQSGNVKLQYLTYVDMTFTSAWRCRCTTLCAVLQDRCIFTFLKLITTSKPL